MLTFYRDVLRGERDTLAFWGLLIAAVVALGVLVTLTMAPRQDRDPPEARASPFPFPFGNVPDLSPPSSAQVIPIPMESPSASPSTVETPPRFAVASPVTSSRRPSPPRATGAAKPQPPWAAWLGKATALELGGRPGLLLRHRDFLARLDPITSASRRTDRADATFVVREGLADDDCLSFESTNFDGFYLRHRDFVLRLTKDDRSRLFREDATFCPEEADDGTLTLRAVNYPDRRLAVQWSLVTLARVTTTKALHVRLRPPP